MQKLHPFFLSALSGLLLFAAWPMSPFTFLSFVALIPLLILERRNIRRRSFFGWVYLSMLIWNIGTTWWIWNSTGPGAAAAIMANSLLMCLPWIGFHWTKRHCGETIGYLSLVVFWLSFEYIHLQNWGLSWPWLTLGNVFATHPGWIQWYAYTGTSGGSLWILATNILLFRWWFVHRKRVLFFWVIAVLLFPIVISIVLAPRSTGGEGDSIGVVIVQPNVDPYAKLEPGSFDMQLQQLIRLSESAIDSGTRLVVWPETAIFSEDEFDEDHLKQTGSLDPLWAFLRRHPEVDLLTGIESSRVFAYKHSPTALRIPNSNDWFESYNAAVILDSSGPVSFYHKTMLVPGVETLPPFLRFLDSWFEKFGGTTAGYTGQPDRTPLISRDRRLAVAASVCYESIYGEFTSQFVHHGAGMLAVITNDAWWGNTPGHLQLENYARLRAIETRRWVVRSANTGISCFIDPAGKIVESGPWEQPAVLRRSVPILQEQTFYANYGDILSKIALAVAALALVCTLIKMTRRG